LRAADTSTAWAQASSPVPARTRPPHDPLAGEPYLAIGEIAGRAASARILLAAALTLDDIERIAGSSIETADELSFDREGLARSSSISARDLVAVFFRQRRLATTTFLLVLAAGILYGFVATTYQAEMKILVRRGRLDPPVTPQATAISDFSRNQVTEEELNSEAEFLRDSEIVREVVLATGLDQVGRRFWLPNESKDSQIERAIRHLSKKLTIEPVRKTTMIAVKYDSGDPKLAAQVLQELAAAYTRKHRQVQRPDGEFSFFEQQGPVQVFLAPSRTI